MSERLNILFVGDIVGEAGLKIFAERLPKLKETIEIDFTIVNAENAAKGKGLTEKEASLLFETGADLLTSGNHIWDNWSAKKLLSENPKILRPLNYPSGNVGYGYSVETLKDGFRLCVLNLQGRTFMQTIDCPFRAADFVLKSVADKADAVVVDFHADATAEKISMARYLDGRAAAVFGTHTHVPTADAQILPKGTAYITDVGMTGPYDSVVGMKKEQAVRRFLYQTPYKYEVAENDAKFAAVLLKLSKETGKALELEQIIYPPFKTKA